MKDSEGQLLLLAVIFLAITLIVLASAATVFLNVKQSPIINESFGVEYGNIKEKFGIALNESANQTYKDKYSYDPSYNISAINDGFNKTKASFEILLSYRGINLEAMLDAGSITNVGQKYIVPVNITMMNEEQYISESVNYMVVL